jgi:transposase
MLSLYAPLEKRVYYLGRGAAAWLLNTVEKQRRKAQSSGLPQDRFLRKAEKIKDNLHQSVVDFILAAFDFFVLPKPIKGAGLGGDNRWMIQHLAFGRFEELLKRKASRQGGTDLLLRVSEACTTMSCGGEGCGLPNHDIGNKEVHVCRYCKTKQARDGGAARNQAFLCSVDEHGTTPTSGTKRKRDQQATKPTDPKRTKHDERRQEQPATTPENKTTNKEVGGSGYATKTAPST